MSATCRGCEYYGAPCPRCCAEAERRAEARNEPADEYDQWQAEARWLDAWWGRG